MSSEDSDTLIRNDSKRERSMSNDSRCHNNWDRIKAYKLTLETKRGSPVQCEKDYVSNHYREGDDTACCTPGSPNGQEEGGRNTDRSIGSPVSTAPALPGKRESSSVMAVNQVTVDVRHKGENAGKLDPAAAQDRPSCSCAGAGGRVLSSSATFSASQNKECCGDTPAPITAVEVSVCGLQRCNTLVPATSTGTKMGASKTRQKLKNYGHVPSHQIDRISQRCAHNLTKSPISLITVNTTNDKPGAFGETSSVCRGESRPDLSPKKEENTEACSSSDISKQTAAPEPARRPRERPTVRLRLSKTIQHLQEMLQREMANDENRPSKQSETDVKTAEPKRFSGRSGSRFRRERSRKRSKSRAAFKVFQCSRKHPPVNTRERPYRQWMGVGNCVTSDTRYIVSSTGARCPETENKPERLPDALETKSPSEPAPCLAAEDIEGNVVSSEEVGTKENVSKDNDAAGGETAMPECAHTPTFPNTIISNVAASPSTPGALLTDKPIPGVEAITKHENVKSDLNEDLPAVHEVDDSCSSRTSLILKTDGCAAQQGNSEMCTDCKSFSMPSSPSRDRSRRTKRALPGTDRWVRPPTPHSEYFNDLERPELSSGEPSPQACSRKVLPSSEAVSSSASALAPGEVESDLRDFVRKKRKASSDNPKRRSPPNNGTEKRRSKSKFPIYGTMRTSRQYITPPKQSKKPICHDSLCRESSVFSGSEASTKANQIQPCKAKKMLAEDNSHHGSLETLWSDVSTTTGEGSVMTDDSSSWYRREYLGHQDDALQKRGKKQESSSADLTKEGIGVTEKSTKAPKMNGNAHTRRYMDVQAIVDFKGTLPGQLSFKEGQIMKQMVFSSLGTENEMSYGYYRVGRFKRKKKGLFPSSCVAPIKDTV